MNSYKIPFPILLAREFSVCKACNSKLSWGKIKVYAFVYMLTMLFYRKYLFPNVSAP